MIFLSHIMFIQFLNLYPQTRFWGILFPPFLLFFLPKVSLIDNLFPEGSVPGFSYRKPT